MQGADVDEVGLPALPQAERVTCLCDLRPCLAGHKKKCCCTTHPTCPPVKQRQMKGRLRRRNQGTLQVYTLLSVPYNTLSANTLHGAATLIKQASVKGLLRFS